MLKPEQVNEKFKKAVVKVHPDKNRNRNFREKYLAKRVFELLN
jgi:curved DNA-binding protein CbpA